MLAPVVRKRIDWHAFGITGSTRAELSSQLFNQFLVRDLEKLIWTNGRWLARLVTPPGGLVLDPFAGTGTTGVACLAEGFDCVLIEREDEYLADIRERMAFYEGEGRHSLASKARGTSPSKAGGEDTPLFAPDPEKSD